jgi:putative Mg2+ transporter-C (MgtC) family protein
VPVDLAEVAVNLFAAVVFGAVIGTERAARNQLAGVRTNALVALSAASFVSFSQLFPGDPSQTRVAAQVVSGIGFLGAGIIFRDGLNVLGLNTAATLWCSAAVGLMAGASALGMAGLLTAIVLVINLGLRPLVNFLDNNLPAGMGRRRSYAISVTCAAERENDLRAVLLHKLKLTGLQLTQIDTRMVEDGQQVEMTATVTGEGANDATLEKTASLLAIEAGMRRVSWQAVDTA